MTTFYRVFDISNIVFYVLFGICAFLLLFKAVMTFVAFMPAKKFPDAKKDHKFAIIVPARNESKVINQILDSIQRQSYNQDLLDTYLIVEREDDPTCEIAKGYKNTHVFVRKHLERKGKGHAMDELFAELLEKGFDYEAFFIFDADNVLYPNFIEEMNKVFDQGYDVGLGYRNSKNWNDNWIASCSGFTFLAFNTFDNRPRSKLGFNANICGTGFYISSKVIRKVGGYKFFTLTEDYEFKLYTALNNISTSYNEEAKFLDEQPTSMKASWNQRLRWCKGFGQANKIYSSKLLKCGIKEKGKKLNKLQLALGAIPLAMTMGTIIVYQIFNLTMMIVGLCIHDPSWYLSGIAFGASGLALYLFLAIYTMSLLILERKNINLTFWNSVITIFTNPIFMLLYLPIFVHAVFQKEVKWVAIDHTVKVKTQDLPKELQNIENEKAVAIAALKKEIAALENIENKENKKGK